MDDLLHKINKKKEAPHDKIRLRYLKNLDNSLSLVNELWRECEYVVDKNKDGVNVAPLRVDKLSKYIFNFGEKILLMSATIIDHKNYAKTLGITDYEYIETESTFDPKKAPIHVSTKFNINHTNLNSLLPEISKQVKALCELHKNEKGVIHTHTNSITNYLKESLGEGGRFLYREDGVNNETLLKDHFESEKPTVLVSPSLTMGVDLKDHLARFAIICKAPYLPLGSKRIKKRFEEDKQWYTDKCLQNLIQISGRGIRSVDDWCVTYILDGNVSRLIVDNKNVLPKEFISRFC
jgi:Rad3-related DNA helicase